MTDKELMQQALEALDKYGFAPCDKEEDWQGFKRAITALRERLAQPEQSQRWAVFCAGCRKEWSVPYQHPGKSMCVECEAKLKAQPKQEPVAPYGCCPQCGAKGVWRERRPFGNDKCANGHTYPSAQAITAPPRLEWVGLTEGERMAIAEACGAMSADWLVFVEAVEKALKVKNS